MTSPSISDLPPLVGLSIEAHGAVAPVHQIYDAIASAIRSGELAPGTRLPTVRTLATDLQVAVNTVAKAIRRLEESGLVITRGRAGTVVAAQDAPMRELSQAAAYFAELSKRLGIDRSQADALLDAAFADSNTGP
ncbi:GntR family transcriptional regulator [Devriesea agamarum]|uniref:GntR family transcriptional regulator n=1 Tax=Devriesea agamarum TaxID=472569 RepID=UPI00071DE44E|nr:GntR family transcriptional regulator [Devriesea agamarum]